MFRISVVCILLVAFAVPAWSGTVQDENKAKTQRFYDEVVNKGDMKVVDELLAPGFVDHEALPGFEPNREGCKSFFQALRAAFPDVKFDSHFMMAEGDKVFVYATMTGTQKGDWMGVPASGKKVSVDLMDVLRIADGQAVEHWGVFDAMSMMQQLGQLPAPASGTK